MTTLIVLPRQVLDFELERLWDDFMDAVEYENKTGFVTRVVLKGWHKNGLPHYEALPRDELTYIEGRML